MKEISKVKEMFHYFNIESEVDSIYGNWAVSEQGDVLNYLYSYVVFSIHLYDDDWYSEVKSKSWFKDDCMDDFNKAYERAKNIKGKY